MAVTVFKERKALVLQWDAGEYEGPVEIVTVNAEDGDDVSSTNLTSNAGYAAVSFPLDHTGGFHAAIKDVDGNVLDEGDVEVS
jgi:hypothetical protein